MPVNMTKTYYKKKLSWWSYHDQFNVIHISVVLLKRELSKKFVKMRYVHQKILFIEG
jgi:hypothetical protein